MSEDASALYGLLGQDGLIVLLAGGAFIAVAALLWLPLIRLHPRELPATQAVPAE